MYPTDRQYTKEHEWVMIEDDAATIGITDFAQNQLGDIVFVEIPEKGKQFEKGDVIGSIESVKAVSEIYAPLSGTIVAVNDSLDQAPETVNSSPHGDGWYRKLQITKREELDDLLEPAAYEDLVASSS